MTIEFGIATGVDAQAFGEPGQRKFRLRLMGADDQSASLWVEKEQLQALDLALTQMLAQVGYQERASSAPIAEFPEEAEHDFRVGRMAIGFDPGDGTVVLHTFEIDDREDDRPALRVRLLKEQCAALDIQLKEIIAAGRPVCPLCGASVDKSGHVCVRANGHSKQPIPEKDDGEDS